MVWSNFTQVEALFVDQLAEGSCPTGKKRHPDAERARAALDLARLRRDAEPWRRERRSYFCPVCCGYHLTSKGLGLVA
ncbi:MAG: hypothetical protein ACLQGJ_00620 [Candidatus Dormibacteria bacterium]